MARSQAVEATFPETFEEFRAYLLVHKTIILYGKEWYLDAYHQLRYRPTEDTVNRQLEFGFNVPVIHKGG